MSRRASRLASSCARCGLSAAVARPRGTNPEIGRTALPMSRGGVTAELDARAGFWTVTSPSVGDGTRPDARRASKAPVKSPVDALESGEASDPGSEAESGGAGGAAGAAAREAVAGNEGGGNEGVDENEGTGGAGAGGAGGGGADGAGTAPIVGIWLVRPGSDEKERMPGAIRDF